MRSSLSAGCSRSCCVELVCCHIGIVSWPVRVELKGPGVDFNFIYIRPPSKADDWKEKRGNWRHHRGYYSPVKISLSLEFVWLKFLSSLFFLECSRATPAGKYGQHISLLVQEEGLVTLCIISFLCQRSTSSVSIPPQDDSRVSGGNECRRNKRGKRNERQMVTVHQGAMKTIRVLKLRLVWLHEESCYT